MKPQDWRYECEGGKHVVFSYCGDCTNGDPPPMTPTTGWLLRLDKHKLVFAASSRDDDPELGLVEKENDDCFTYARELVFPKLSAYLDLPRNVRLNAVFAAKLREIASRNAPEGRRKDWECQIASKDSSDLSGELLRDYRLWHSADGTLSSQPTLCFEIKPKAGYLAISPLVDPKRRVKYLISRFRIFQRLTEKKRYLKSWMNTDDLSSFQASSYDPLDLFSGEKERISRALSDLILSPQNNLGVWKGRECMLGRSAPSHDVVDWKRILESLGVDVEQLDQALARDQIIDFVSTVLMAEPCLDSLLKLQKLDVLDGDGAVLVYQRLVRLCHGSHERAEALLDKNPIHINEETDQGNLMGASPIGLSLRTGGNLEAFYDQAKAYSYLLKSSQPGLPATCQMDNARIKALDLVSVFSLDECVYLLQNWLLSLSMCDISFFVTFAATKNKRAFRELDCALHPHIAKLQCGELPGLLQIQHVTKQSPMSLSYFVKVIDYDKKPAKKLRNCLKKEEHVDEWDD